MGTPALSDVESERRKAAVEAALREWFTPRDITGGKGSSITESAKRLGIGRGAMHSWIISQDGLKSTHKKNFSPDWTIYQPPALIAPEIVEKAQATVDDRIRERRLEQELAALKRHQKDLLDQVISLQDVRGTIMNLAEALEAPAIIRPVPGSRKGGKRIAILHISDVHCGESVDLYEMDGLNSYSGEICKARMNRLFQKTASLLTEHWSGDPVEEIVVCLGGDMIDGNLREESRRGGAMPVVESAKLISELTAGGIKFLHEQVGVPIRVYTSPGNHGRLSLKPHVNEGAIDNWDIMISWSIEKILGNQDWVKFYYTGSGEALFNVYGWWFLLQHGHEGVGGTGGLYGPVYKQVRGMYRTHQSYGRRGRGFHYVLEGHNHTSVKIPFGFANGSVVGYSPYSARALKADPSPASQNLLTVEERLGVIAWNELFLGAPQEGTLYEPPVIEEGRLGKPVMRVRATGERT
ncbi:metallophosphoesterase [Mesorhizobium sp. M0189]|uniref:metallophosphoesterase n=1 Tax=Mesorhizobium sp. M0189 TaxID=2956909 RepID=UPI003334FA1F